MGTRAGLVALLVGAVLAASSSPAGATAPRVIGGRVVPRGTYPWMVALLRAGEGGAGAAQFCGGALVSPAWVLTAAHCVAGEGGQLAPEQIVAAPGAWALSQVAAADLRGVARIEVHPGYRVVGQDAVDDLALLRLVRPAPILPAAVAGTPAVAGERARVVGWGDTRSGGVSRYPDVLHDADVPVLEDAACAAVDVYGSRFDPVSMLCAGPLEGGIDACAGDSGGPLVVGEGVAATVIGVVSFGDGCARPKRPGVYARIASHAAWILEQTSRSEPDGLAVEGVEERGGGLLVRARVARGAGLWRLVLRGPGGVRRQLGPEGFAGGVVLRRRVAGLAPGRWQVVLEAIGVDRHGSAPLVADVVGPPRLRIAPWVAGTPVPGARMRCAVGAWVGDGPLRFAVRWERGRRRVVVGRELDRRAEPADAGKLLRCVVTASDRRGSRTVPAPWVRIRG